MRQYLYEDLTSFSHRTTITTKMDEKYEYIINASSDFITLIDRNYVYTVVNDSYC